VSLVLDAETTERSLKSEKKKRVQKSSAPPAANDVRRHLDLLVACVLRFYKV
jgi:hypothetical protein